MQTSGFKRLRSWSSFQQVQFGFFVQNEETQIESKYKSTIKICEHQGFSALGGHGLAWKFPFCILLIVKTHQVLPETTGCFPHRPVWASSELSGDPPTEVEVLGSAAGAPKQIGRAHV